MDIRRMGRRSVSPIFVLLLFVAVAALVLAIGACATPPPAKPPVAIAVSPSTATAPSQASENYASEEDAPIPVNHDDPTFGSRLAPVTVVVFSDFQCPFCGKFAATLHQLREEYRPEDVRIVWKNEPLAFHQHARLAAEVGQGVYALAGAKAFWKFHDTAFRRQQVMSPEAIRAWAVDAGVDSGALEDGLTRKRWAQKVDYDVAVANKVGATGTPTSFINGVRLSGAQPYDKLKQMVEAQLEKGKGLAAAGTARDQVYVTATRANFEAPKARVDHDDDDDDDHDAKAIFRVPVAGSPVRGPATALVTIVMFSDFQCPYCKRVEPTLEQVRTTYGDKVRIVWKDEPLPFHPRARPAAELARFARSQKGDAGFWAVHDALFASQPKLDDADLEAVAKGAGLDAKKAMASVNAKTHARAIDRDLDLGDDVQASGTPHFFINGRRIVGAQPFEKFKSLIDEEMIRAEAAVKSGVTRAALYDHLIKDGKTASEPERRSVAAAPATAPFRGVANAKVTVQIFSDFQCPFCSRVEPVLEELLKDYAGKIKIVWRDHPLPMHPDAPLAAEAAREAHAQKGNEGFAKMRALLFANQTALGRQALDGYAAQIGLDVARFGRALDGHVHKAAVDADAAAATAASANGTPSFFIGPYFLSGAQPITKFRKLVELTLNPPPAPPAAPVAALPAGLVVKDTVVGKGAVVKAGDKLKVEYTGTLTNGTQFDSSRGRQPFTFTIGKGQVIKGWEQGLLGMRVGGIRKLTIPPALGYGARGAGAAIPPDATLLFDVELLAIEP